MSFSVLVVEDEYSFRLALEVHIEQSIEGVEVKSLSGDPNELEEYFRSDPTPDLAIIDLQLPGNQGFDPDGGFGIIGRLEALNAAIPVIVLTVRNDHEAETERQKHPSIKHMGTKPWDPEQLTEWILDCRGRSGGGRL
jgi:CheY-like chemotaxis protein